MKMVKFLIKLGSVYGPNVDVEDLIPDAITVSRSVKKAALEKPTQEGELVSSGEASNTISMWTDNLNVS